MNSNQVEAGWLPAVVYRAVRAAETSLGRMDDDDAFRTAARSSRDPSKRLLKRAWLLAARPQGILEELDWWRTVTPILLALAALLVGVISWEALSTVAGDGRAINAIYALVAVLTLPTFSLTVWLLGLMWPGSTKGGGVSRWALALASRVPGLRTPSGPRLLKAGLEVLGQTRLVPWLLGLANHLVWIGAFAIILLGLSGSFAFRKYTLSWETTILQPEHFVGMVSTLGWFPSLLGFPVPVAAAVSDASLLATDQRNWAWWLIGCTFTYGLLPRLLAALACWGVWRKRKSRLCQVDQTDQYARELLLRFKHWDESAADLGVASSDTADSGSSRKLVAAIGFELPHELEWQVQPMAPEVGWFSRIEGTAQERREALDHIAQARPYRVLVACNAFATPDRGTARFLHAAASNHTQGAVLLLGDVDLERWKAWLKINQMDSLRVFGDALEAQAWLTEPGNV